MDSSIAERQLIFRAACADIRVHSSDIIRPSSIAIACAVLMVAVARVPEGAIPPRVEEWLRAHVNFCGKSALLEIVSLLGDVVARMSEPPTAVDRRVNCALTYIAQHYHNASLDLTTVSQHVRLSRWHL